MRSPGILVLAVSILALPFPVRGDSPSSPEWFPFVIPWDDAAVNATDVSFLNPAPLEERHRITARDGHFYDATGKRVRFFGVNFTYSANFMNKEDAPIVAARLHKFGVNMVRLHHMDMLPSPNGIWPAKADNTLTLDAEQVDRLDYLVYQLKQHGIYIDLNLFVSRPWKDADGVPETAKLPWSGKGAAYFEPRMIELQKQYAHALLDRVNPYTKLRYADDPVVALIEINNEDTILGPARALVLRNLPEHYRTILQTGWNKFLRERYKSTDAMLAQWNMGAKPYGPNLIPNGRFEKGAAGWRLQAPQPVEASTAFESVAGEGEIPYGRAAHLRLIRTLPGMAPALKSLFFATNAGASYRLTFHAKASTPERPLRIRIQQINKGSSPVLESTIKLAKKWLTFTLVLPQTTAGRTEIEFAYPGLPAGDVWLGDITLREGNASELQAGQTLETGNIELPLVSFAGHGTRQEADYYAFLMDVEKRYVDELSSYIKNTLGAHAPLSCSQIGWGGLGALVRESRLDFVDMHGYWQHPDFPYADWSDKNWFIPNTPMVRDAAGGTATYLAMHRLQGKPYTVTEYAHPAPNDFAAESVPLITAYAAAQDWDAILFFQYGQNRWKWNSDRIEGWWNIYSNPSKLAYFPAAALLFLGGRMPVAPHSLQVTVPESDIPALLARYGASMPPVWHGLFGDGVQPFMNSQATVRLTSKPEKAHSRRTMAAQNYDAFFWRPEKGVCKVSSPEARFLLGYPGAEWLKADGLSVNVRGEKDIPVALTLSARDGKPLRDSSSLLLTIGSRFENLNMGWNGARTSIGNQWGQGPVQARGVTAKIELESHARSVTIFALNARGERKAEVPAILKAGKLVFQIDPSYATVWYEISASPLVEKRK